MAIRNQYTQQFECGYYQDIAFHKDNTNHGIPNKLDINEHFNGNCQSKRQGE